MKRKNKNIRIFWRSALLTAVTVFCVAAIFLGVCKSYEEMQKLMQGQEKSAVYIGRDKIRILDFEIEFSK